MRKDSGWQKQTSLVPCGEEMEQQFLSAEAVGQKKNGKNRMIVAAYIRVSTDLEDQENSYQTQEQYFLKHLTERKEWHFGGIYSDYGISGTLNEKRIGFQRLLRHCEDGRIDRIVCKSISRFARNTNDFMHAMKLLTEHQVSICFEKEELDTADPVSGFVVTTLAAIAQEESHSISANVSWGFRKRYPRGEAWNLVIYGYQKCEADRRRKQAQGGLHWSEVEIVESEAAVVRRIFSEIAEGHSYTEVARGLNLDRIPAPAGRKSRVRGLETGWTAQDISGMLRLERYTGDVLLQKTYTRDYLTHKVQKNRGEMPMYWVRKHHPAIIDQELFEQVQEVIQRNSIRYARGRHPLRPLSGCLICSGCGRYYHVRNRRSRAIWYCPSTVLNNGRVICQAERVYEEQLMRMFRKAVLDRFQPLPGDDGLWGDENFPEQLSARLKRVQQTNHAERDQSFLKRMDPKGDERLQEDMSCLKEYWEKLEEGYENRERTIAWLDTLPGGLEGRQQFLLSVSDEDMRALVLSVTIHSPYQYTIFWFDGIRTDVRMTTNMSCRRGRRSSGEKRKIDGGKRKKR